MERSCKRNGIVAIATCLQPVLLLPTGIVKIGRFSSHIGKEADHEQQSSPPSSSTIDESSRPVQGYGPRRNRRRHIADRFRVLANGDGGKATIPPPVGVLLVSMIVPPADMPTTLPAVAIWHVDHPAECRSPLGLHLYACTWVDAVHLLEGQYDCWFEGRVRLYRFGKTPCDLEPAVSSACLAGDSFLALDRMMASSIVNPGPDPAREFTASSTPAIRRSIRDRRWMTGSMFNPAEG